MANEIRVTCSLQIAAGNLVYRSQPTQFLDSLVTATPKGPVPGAIAVTTSGTNIDFSQLAQPKWCRFSNQDLVNTVAVGTWDGTNFQAVFDVAPGQSIVMPLSSLLGDTVGTGSGTVDTGDGPLRAKGINGPATLLVEAFEA